MWPFQKLLDPLLPILKLMYPVPIDVVVAEIAADPIFTNEFPVALHPQAKFVLSVVAEENPNDGGVPAP